MAQFVTKCSQEDASNVRVQPALVQFEGSVNREAGNEALMHDDVSNLDHLSNLISILEIQSDT